MNFHFKTLQGIQTLTDDEAEPVIAKDRESHERDLFETIARGDFPKWRRMVQIMPEHDAEQTPYDPVYLTKVWPQGVYPFQEVGIMELDKRSENYFADQEQSAFSLADVVPGVSLSLDKMLQLRIFSYADAHRYRLGVNYELLPVNRRRVPVHTNHRDGLMRFDGNACGAVNYEPNSMGGPLEDAKYKGPPLALAGDTDCYDHHEDNDDFTQAGNLYRLMTGEQRERLHRAILGAMDGIPRKIVERQLGHFAKTDPAYASGVKKALGR